VGAEIIHEMLTDFGKQVEIVKHKNTHYVINEQRTSARDDADPIQMLISRLCLTQRVESGPRITGKRARPRPITAGVRKSYSSRDYHGQNSVLIVPR
jgi:hypothetical protein